MHSAQGVPGHQGGSQAGRAVIRQEGADCRPCTALRFGMVIRVTFCQFGEMSSLESLAQLKEAQEW